MDKDLTVGFGMPTVGLNELSLCINADVFSEYKSVKVMCNGVEHTYDTARLKDALVWLLAPYEIREEPNPSHECMRREREEKRAALLDMRRWDVTRRLNALELPESGSHDMLSRIVKTIYDPIGGWTREACERLRSQLVELIGGERASDVQSVCACDTGDCVCHDMQEEMKPPFILRYDTLGNERHKAVCKLQKIPDATGKFSFSSHYFYMQNIFDALGIQEPYWTKRVDMLRDCLIHLLGGDQVVGCPEKYNLDSKTSAEDVKNGDVSQIDESMPTITDELRKWANTEVPYKYGNRLHAIADRIDEQFARICEQQERVLQDTINHMQDEIDEHKEQRRLLARDCLGYTDECWNLYDLLRDAACEYKKLKQSLNKATGKWAKADAECRMYRDILNDEAREYVRHMEATDSMYESFNKVFEAIERLL